MNKNLIIIVAAVIILFVIFKMMKMMKENSEIMKSQSDAIMAIAIKTGAVQPAQEEKKKIAGKKEVESKPASEPVVPKKNIVLTVAHKRLVKLFDDEVPKTASQLRTLYNKLAPAPVEAKKFNSMLWNIRNNKGIITFEKFEDSDSVWGLTEWFEQDGENSKLQDEFFSKIKTA